MIEKLKDHIPSKVYQELVSSPWTVDLSPLRLAHFLAQCDHESMGFQCVVENLNYSEEALTRVFPKYYKDAKLAKLHARKPELIGAHVYANRMGNGSEQSGNGFYRRGRGYLQITGTNNQRAFFKYICIPEDSDPELISKNYPLASAKWFFDDNQLWKWCDVGATKEAVINVSKKINGGAIGIDDRIEKFNHYWGLLN